MADTLLDATILIDATNDHPLAVQYIDRLVAAQAAFTHAQVVAEVMEVTRDAKELARLRRFLRRFLLVHPNEADSKSGLDYLSRFHLSHNLGFGDCLIGSTALRLNLPVVTINDRHFRLFQGLHVIHPY